MLLPNVSKRGISPHLISPSPEEESLLTHVSDSGNLSSPPLPSFGRPIFPHLCLLKNNLVSPLTCFRRK